MGGVEAQLESDEQRLLQGEFDIQEAERQIEQMQQEKQAAEDALAVVQLQVVRAEEAATSAHSARAEAEARSAELSTKLAAQRQQIGALDKAKTSLETEHQLAMHAQREVCSPDVCLLLVTSLFFTLHLPICCKHPGGTQGASSRSDGGCCGAENG